MPGHDYSRIELRRLSQVSPQAIIELMNQRAVRRHLPLARGDFGPSDCEKFVAAKERMWEENGYGPWAFVLDDEFIGWGGLQPEGGDVDVGLVLDQLTPDRSRDSIRVIPRGRPRLVGSPPRFWRCCWRSWSAR